MILIITAIVILVMVIVFIYYKTNINLQTDNSLIMQLDEKNIMLDKSGIQMSEDYLPTNEKDIVTKKYLDNKLTDATATTTGIIKLSGDLTGTATNPKITDNVIGLNNFSNLSQKNCLLGTIDDDKIVGEVKIGDQLNIANNILNTNKKLIYTMYKHESDLWFVKIDENINYYTDSSSIQIVSTSTNNVYIDNYDTTIGSLHYFTIHGGKTDCYIKILYTIPAVATSLIQYDANIYINDIADTNIPKTTSSVLNNHGSAPVGMAYIKIDAGSDYNISIKVIYTSGDTNSFIGVYGGAFISFEEI